MDNQHGNIDPSAFPPRHMQPVRPPPARGIARDMDAVRAEYDYEIREDFLGYMPDVDMAEGAYKQWKKELRKLEEGKTPSTTEEELRTRGDSIRDRLLSEYEVALDEAAKTRANELADERKNIPNLSPEATRRLTANMTYREATMNYIIRMLPDNTRLGKALALNWDEFMDQQFGGDMSTADEAEFRSVGEEEAARLLSGSGIVETRRREREAGGVAGQPQPNPQPNPPPPAGTVSGRPIDPVEEKKRREGPIPFPYPRRRLDPRRPRPDGPQPPGTYPSVDGEEVTPPRAVGTGYLRPSFEVGGQDVLQLTEKERIEEVKEWDLFDFPISENDEPTNPLYLLRLKQSAFRFSMRAPTFNTCGERAIFGDGEETFKYAMHVPSLFTERVHEPIAPPKSLIDAMEPVFMNQLEREQLGAGKFFNPYQLAPYTTPMPPYRTDLSVIQDMLQRQNIFSDLPHLISV
jgi:hypothetical protein